MSRALTIMKSGAGMDSIGTALYVSPHMYFSRPSELGFPPLLLPSSHRSSTQEFPAARLRSPTPRDATTQPRSRL